MAPTLATNRLRKELIRMRKEPLPGIIATPQENDILIWYYAIRGPLDTPYDGGIYVGKLKFPSEYPMKGPSISMLTPSGRFQINTKICMSMSGDFHPGTYIGVLQRIFVPKLAWVSQDLSFWLWSLFPSVTSYHLDPSENTT